MFFLNPTDHTDVTRDKNVQIGCGLKIQMNCFRAVINIKKRLHLESNERIYLGKMERGLEVSVVG